ncbi:MAG: hypothetical protein U9Q82_01035, partial [Chloroflexota bacterium]|nr:hypothetical protein [Chloroflexota bacterium]
EEEIFYTTTVLLRRLTPALLVLLFGGLLFFFAVKRIRLIQKIPSDSARSLSTNTILIYIVLGTLLSFGIGLTPQEAGCGEDVISAYESGGAHLAEYIPAGSKIYWRGGLSPIPLLYLPDVKLYLPQLNDGYSYRLGGDPDELVRYGWWNEELAARWRQEADVFLVEEWRGGMESEFFDEVSPTQPLLSCQHGSEIHIYIREK